VTSFSIGRCIWGGFLGFFIGLLGSLIDGSRWWWIALPIVAAGFGFGVDKLLSIMMMSSPDDGES